VQKAVAMQAILRKAQFSAGERWKEGVSAIFEENAV
jgi:hypothetical protein